MRVNGEGAAIEAPHPFVGRQGGRTAVRKPLHHRKADVELGLLVSRHLENPAELEGSGIQAQGQHDALVVASFDAATLAREGLNIGYITTLHVIGKADRC